MYKYLAINSFDNSYSENEENTVRYFDNNVIEVNTTFMSNSIDLYFINEETFRSDYKIENCVNDLLKPTEEELDYIELVYGEVVKLMYLEGLTVLLLDMENKKDANIN